MRTTVSVEKSLARQQINEEFTLELSISDVSDTSDADARAAELAIEHPCQLLDLTTGPLVRKGLVRTAEEDHLLLLAFHHFAFDAWSETILIRELAANYEVFDTGQTPCQDELAIQFADYAVWERQATRPARFDDDRAYWKPKLAEPPALQLPTDYSRPLRPGEKAGEVSIDVPRRVVSGLRELAREEQTTIFSTLLAAFVTLLHRYSAPGRYHRHLSGCSKDAR